ncbi:hypothetical protein BD414DRAFT_511072 [Trametes punicea]|nr:hypothetical protein BD414DRAFT_511072 [Trametes punicea]
MLGKAFPAAYRSCAVNILNHCNSEDDGRISVDTYLRRACHLNSKSIRANCRGKPPLAGASGVKPTYAVPAIATTEFRQTLDYICSTPEAGLGWLSSAANSRGGHDAYRAVEKRCVLYKCEASAIRKWTDDINYRYMELSDGMTIVPAGLSGSVLVGIDSSKHNPSCANFVSDSRSATSCSIHINPKAVIDRTTGAHNLSVREAQFEPH